MKLSSAEFTSAAMAKGVLPKTSGFSIRMVKLEGESGLEDHVITLLVSWNLRKSR